MAAQDATGASARGRRDGASTPGRGEPRINDGRTPMNRSLDSMLTNGQRLRPQSSKKVNECGGREDLRACIISDDLGKALLYNDITFWRIIFVLL